MSGPPRPGVIEVRAAVRTDLVHVTRSPAVAAGRARRARIVRLAAHGTPVRHSGPQVGLQRHVVRAWRDRFRARGRDGLRDRPRPGRPRRFAP